MRRARYPLPPHRQHVRHAFPASSTTLLEQGVSIKAVAERLGHTDPAFTLATIDKIFWETKAAA